MNQVPAFWRAIGGSLMVSVALGFVTIYNGIKSDLAQIRHELAHEQEIRLQLLTTAEFESAMQAQDAELQAIEESLAGSPTYPTSPVPEATFGS